MAAPSRMLLKSTLAALNLFAKSKSVLNRLPLRASAGLAIPSASAKFTDQLAVPKAVVIEQQLPVGIRGLEEMLIARGRPPPKVVDSEEDDDDGDEEDDDDEFEDFDDDELEDAVDEDDDDDVATWKKVRTRSDRDAW